MIEAGSTTVANTRASMHIHAALILHAVVPFFPPFFNLQTLDGVVNRARVLYYQQNHEWAINWVFEMGKERALDVDSCPDFCASL